MTKTFCDICHEECKESVSLTTYNTDNTPLSPLEVEKIYLHHICISCVDKIKEFISSLQAKE